MKAWWMRAAVGTAMAVYVTYFGLAYLTWLPRPLLERPWLFEGFAVVSLILAAMGMVRSRARRTVLAAVSVLLLSAGFVVYVRIYTAALPPPTSALKAGQRAPDFTLPAHDGTPVRLSALRGRPVVLTFYRGFW
jgi:hypothetical protein